jgi:hypothetical protein
MWPHIIAIYWISNSINFTVLFIFIWYLYSQKRNFCILPYFHKYMKLYTVLQLTCQEQGIFLLRHFITSFVAKSGIPSCWENKEGLPCSLRNIFQPWPFQNVQEIYCFVSMGNLVSYNMVWKNRLTDFRPKCWGEYSNLSEVTRYGSKLHNKELQLFSGYG